MADCAPMAIGSCQRRTRHGDRVRRETWSTEVVRSLRGCCGARG
ncbi:hypothetical protein ES319_A01G083900v1 [Gossypium barbadense]|uniref:Uncharacterized protein n=3 Tax=Gossypium TaxID=3633 RepID=A0A5J5WUS7_GOSBA|nr:hypothetical protein ES319_A01G083900v1 [Gossypium barbadense]TYH30401.1 hypothetical protein ES288_A01G092000v1 [Gossypium darwinii]TYI42443.1 hypothetical protein ES332_A01G098900v1 [Gossypium tomentosum]